MTITLNPAQFYTLHSPSKCDLRLYLNQKGAASAPPGVFEDILFRLGERHENASLAVFPVYTDLTGSGLEKTIEEIQKESPVIYQGRLEAKTIIDGQPVKVVGIPDFMIRDDGGYVIRDCKLARNIGTHPEIPCQLQVYGWLFEKVIGMPPLRLEVILGDGRIASFAYGGEAVILSHLSSLLQIILLPEEPYSPVGWTKCVGCGYYDLCWHRAYKKQDVALVYGVDQSLAMVLRRAGATTIKKLLNNFDEDRLSELRKPWGDKVQKVGKAAEGILCQAEAMFNNKMKILRKPDLPQFENYVMFDLEGLPPYLDEMDKIYLWGMQVFGKIETGFHYSLAEIGPEGDRKGWEEFLSIAGRLFEEYGDIPFVHWHHYESTKIKAYIKRYGDRGNTVRHDV